MSTPDSTTPPPPAPRKVRWGGPVAGIGVLLMVVGLIFGFSPVHAAGVNCGSAFHATDDASVQDLGNTLSGGNGFTGTEAACDTARADRQPAPIALLVVGGLVLLTGGIKAGSGSAGSWEGRAAADRAARTE